MKKKAIFLLACLSVFFALSGFAKGALYQKAAGKLLNDNLQEKIYLHFDKPYYAAGDNIWFKAYITTGAKHQLSTISSVLNVELIDERDSVRQHIKLPIIAGVAWGDFKLDESLTDGNYRIRAYTNWMRNASNEFFFDKTIQLGAGVNNVVSTTVNYNYSNQNGQQKTNALIQYADASGNPYVGKEITYTVMLDGSNTQKGRVITNANGSISIDFENKVPSKSGIISTAIKLKPDLKPIIKIIPVKATTGKVDIGFFPESGSLVNNVPCKVAFKAVGTDGLGVDLKGIISDNDGKRVAIIESQHLGMGFFYITPQANKTYTAQITYPDGKGDVLTLPAANNNGYVLSVNNDLSSPDVIVNVLQNQATYKENSATGFTLVAQVGSKVIITKIDAETTSFPVRLPRDRFPTGIAVFTLFNAKGDPLNERIAFIQNPDLLDIDLHTAKQTFAPREKVKLNMVAKNKAGQPVNGAFSIAVIDETKVPFDEGSEHTILTDLLLTSNIKGYVEKPNYYFNNVNDKTRAHLDLLMLTQGYRHFSLMPTAQTATGLAFEVEKSLNITGHIKTLNGKPIQHGKVSLLSTSGGVFYLDTVADEDGRFIFKGLVFTDTVKFMVQARTSNNNRDVEITLDNIEPQAVTHNKNTGDIMVNISNNMASYLQNNKKQYTSLLKYGLISKSITLKEVAIADIKNPPPGTGNLNGAGHADKIVTAEKLINCLNFIDCLKYNFGIKFVNDTAYLPYAATLGITKPSMLIIIDGVNVDPLALVSLTSTDVLSAELLRSPEYLSLYGSKGGGGVLIVTTKHGDEDTPVKRYSPGILTYAPIGYHKIRQFYAPRYDDPKINPKVADLRTTIYWQPNIITDKNGTASLEFFNADTPGTYRAVIEGIDGYGNIGRQVYRYKVQ